MVLQTTGPLRLSDIVGEFGGTAPHSLSELYGTIIGIDVTLPSDGPLSLSDFYGAMKNPYPPTWLSDTDLGIAGVGSSFSRVLFAESDSAIVSYGIDSGPPFAFISTSNEFSAGAAGVLTGTLPLTDEETEYTWLIGAMDSELQVTTEEFTILALVPPFWDPEVYATPYSIGDFKRGDSFVENFEASGSSPITYAVGGFDWMNINAETGTFFGTVPSDLSYDGSFGFYVFAINPVGSALLIPALLRVYTPVQWLFSGTFDVGAHPVDDYFESSLPGVVGTAVDNFSIEDTSQYWIEVYEVSPSVPRVFGDIPGNQSPGTYVFSVLASNEWGEAKLTCSIRVYVPVSWSLYDDYYYLGEFYPGDSVFRAVTSTGSDITGYSMNYATWLTFFGAGDTWGNTVYISGTVPSWASFGTNYFEMVVYNPWGSAILPCYIDIVPLAPPYYPSSNVYLGQYRRLEYIGVSCAAVGEQITYSSAQLTWLSLNTQTGFLSGIVDEFAVFARYYLDIVATNSSGSATLRVEFDVVQSYEF